MKKIPDVDTIIDKFLPSNSMQTSVIQTSCDTITGAISESIEAMDIEPGLRFVILRPSGNDTCLVYGIIHDEDERKRINDAIMAEYPEVEQVGFVCFGEAGNELMMAGGEFCGNATRSAVALALNGRPGSITMHVSGASRPLNAGIDEKGNSWTEMPILSSLDAIQPGKNEQEVVVTMEGISHIIVFVDTVEADQQVLKQKAMNLIKEYGLDENPAAGVIFTRNEEGIYIIDPIVYVKSIDTLIYESGCGSGTTALAMSLAKQKGQSVEKLEVMQPSGMPIQVSIQLEDNQFTGATIAGPVETLVESQQFKKGTENFSVDTVRSVAALKDIQNKGLTNLYKKVFADPPYCESFTDEEVNIMLEEYLADGILLTARKNKEIIAFAATLPLVKVPAVQASLAETTDSNAWYIAEVGTAHSMRRKGIGRLLTTMELTSLPDVRTFIMRTSEKNFISQSLHSSLGFKKIEGVAQDVAQARMNEEDVETDRRIFMCLNR
ncbi:MAG: hypothetical protein JWM56_400 [Candidatus Peribacteria bacterium]|nr:hypothetical protein [Candidatus Peribacteria bacterium]